MPMHINQQMEQFSNAYLSSIVAAAGYSMSKPGVDDSSIDWMVKGYRDAGLNYTPQLDIQLKCARNSAYRSSDTIDYDLKAKNYNDLCETQIIVPRILIVVIVPDDPQDWVYHTENELLLRHCGYWLSLRGESPILQTKKRIYLPRTQVLSVDGLRGLMQRIGMRGEL
jgi:hypothetical protein